MDKISVKDFCEKMNQLTSEKAKDALLDKIILKNHYMNYEDKVAMCRKIVFVSSYKNSGNDSYEFVRDTTAEYMLFALQCISQYSCIEINFSSGGLEDFNMLNKNGYIDKLLSHMPENEMKEIRVIFQMVKDDMFFNEQNTINFIKTVGNKLYEIIHDLIQNVDFDDLLQNIKQ